MTNLFISLLGTQVETRDDQPKIAGFHPRYDRFVQRIGALLVGIAVLSSCSRPVAYFQRGPVESSLPKASVVTIASPVQTANPAVREFPETDLTSTLAEASVGNTRNESTGQQLARHAVRAKSLLASPQATKAVASSRKLNLVERLVLKKLNKKISKQLAPNHPEQAMLKTGTLIGSLVLLVGGLILLIAGTGTVAFIGLILSLIGAVGTIVALFGI
ncbi:hypothetical protein [Spirosoma koreense]